MGFRGILLLLALVLAAGCGEDAPGSPDADQDRPERTLRFEPGGTQTLLPGKELEFAVQVRDSAGEAVSDVAVELALLDDAPGASLSTVSPRTDRKGMARATLQAGSDASTFRIRARAEGAETAYLRIEVGEVEFRTVILDVAYSGRRKIATRTITARPNVTCETARMDRMPGPLNQTITAPRTTMTLRLDPGVSYAVFAWGRGLGGGVLAFGCEDITYGLEEKADDEEPDALLLPLEDSELQLVQPETGPFDIELEFDVSASSARLGAAAREAGQALAPQSLEPDAEALLEAIERDVRENQGDAAAEAIVALRADPTAAASLGASLRTAMVGPSRMLAELETLLADSAERLVAKARYTVDEAATMGLEIDALFGSRAGGLPLALPAELLANTYVSFAAVFDEPLAEITISELRLTLPLHAYGLAVFDELDKGNPSGVFGLLSQPLGCGALSTWVAARPVVATACDAACQKRSCEDVGKRLLAAARARISEPSPDRTALTVRGQVSVVDRDDDKFVDAISSTSLSPSPAPPSDPTIVTERLAGTWHGSDPEQPDQDVVAAELRMAPPPIGP